MKLIIAEKEEAARSIAEALGADSEVREEVKGHRITYFEGSGLIIVPARGHLIEPIPKGIRFAKLWELPILNIEWKVRDREADARLRLIKMLSGQAEEVIVATDWDREGESIGYNICYHKLKLKNLADFRRMYFNALTPEFIRKAYENLTYMDESLLTKGLARSIADSIIGLNITKALTLRFKALYPEVKQAFSLGRVQSPLLAYVTLKTRADFEVKPSTYEREEEDYKYFIVYSVNGETYSIEVYEDLGEELVVKDIKKTVEEFTQAELLYDTNGIISAVKELPPSETMEVMEQMYLKGWLTYPRTKSKWVSEEYLSQVFEAMKTYIPKLSEGNFSVENSPSTNSWYAEGGKFAILLTPEGVKAYFENYMSLKEKIVATRVLRRMVVTLAPPVRKETTYVIVENEEGERHEIEWCSKILNNPVEIVSYESSYERPLPAIGDKLRVVKHRLYEKRKSHYSSLDIEVSKLTDSNMVEWMMSVGLGTEATRHEFPKILRERHYISNSNIPTLLGLKVSQVISRIGLDEKLTKKMEWRIEKLETLRQLSFFQKWIGEITKTLIENIKELPDEIFKFKCSKGHELKIAQYGGKRTAIIGKCPECNTRYVITL